MDRARPFVVESWPMGRYFFFGFFYFPCLAAEGTG